jgi:hypothetical protein
MKDESLVDEEDVISEIFGESKFVGGEDALRSVVAEVGDEVQHFTGHEGIEGGSGFVEEEDTRFDDERSGDGDTLALAAGELRWRSVRVGAEA